MTSKNYFAALSLAVLSISGLGISNSYMQASELNTQGGKGARIYCYMRNSGNAHEVSWNASYALIKRQTNSMFKTSPKHAAVMIIETVVQNPEKFETCGSYLGDLFGPPDLNIIKEELPSEVTEEPVEVNKGDRYSY